MEQLLVSLQTVLAEHLAWLTTVSLAVITVLLVSRVKLARLDRREHELQLAQKALDAHMSALKDILSDPAPSKELKARICGFSSAITSKEFAHFLVQSANEGTLFDRRFKPSKDEYAVELRKLTKVNPDFASSFHVVMESGLVAMLLRWPDTARGFTQIATIMASATTREIQVAETAYTFFASKEKNTGLHTVMAAA